MKNASWAVALVLLLWFAGCASVSSPPGSRTSVPPPQQITAEDLEKRLGRKPTPQEVKDADEQLHTWSRIWELADRHNFLIAGEVVDEEGKPLDGVKLSVVRVYSGTPFNWNPRYDEAKVSTANGVFRVKESGCEDVYLAFEKGGYYRESLQLGSSEMQELAQAIAKGEKWRGYETGKSGLRVVMERRGITTSLTKYLDVLEYQGDRGGVVLNLSRSQEAGFVRVQSTADPSLLPKECVYVVPEMDENGDIPMVDANRPGQRLARRLYPKKIRLVLNLQQDDTGFLPYAATNNRRPLHEMKQAPEKGYETEIVIGVDAWTDILQRYLFPVLLQDTCRIRQGQGVRCPR